MIYQETKLNISDNSGVLKSKCIKALKASLKRGASVNNVLVVSLRKVKSNKKFKKGQMVKGVLVRIKKNELRNSGFGIKFSDNSIVLINDSNMPLSSRIFGPISKKLDSKNF